MLNRTELLERITNGENSRVEFKHDACRPDELAKEMAALHQCDAITERSWTLSRRMTASLSGFGRSRNTAEITFSALNELLNLQAHREGEPLLVGAFVGVAKEDLAAPDVQPGGSGSLSRPTQAN